LGRLRRTLAFSVTLATAAAPFGGAGAQAARTAQPRQAADSAIAARGTVFDSLGRKPLAGAMVQFVGAADGSAVGPAYSAPTDSAGHYEIPNLRPGRYVVGFYHPLLDSLRVEPPLRSVEVTRPVTVDLGTPSGATLLAAFCGATASGDSTGFLAGWVYGADSRRPVPGASVLVTWRELVVDARGLRMEHRRRAASADSAGFYVACQVPSDVELLASADAGRRHTGLLGIDVPLRGMLRQNFAIADSGAVTPSGDSVVVARGNARLTGRVLDTRGQPIAGARVSLWRAGIGGTTTATGNFTLGALPAGTFALEARALGKAPERVPVELASGRATAVTVTLEEAAVALAPVTVLGKPSARQRDINGFLARSQRGGFGRFITREDIERRNPVFLTDELRRLPGMTVSQGGPGERVIVGRGGCRPAVILDGSPIVDGSKSLDLLVNPRDVLGIEVYQDPGTAPPQYTGIGGNCGVILVWTGP
jgi:hypothetical protein